MGVFVLRILTIPLLAGGLAVGYVEYKGLSWKYDGVDERLAAYRDQASISLDEFVALLEQGSVILDARTPAQFEQAHLQVNYEPPVLNAYPDDIDAQIGRLDQLRGQLIVLYCNGPECDLAEEAYAKLVETYGFNAADLRIYPDGWDGILAAGLPTTSGPDRWRGYGAHYAVEPNHAEFAEPDQLEAALDTDVESAAAAEDIDG